jgi:hypothetical protein
MRSTVERSVAVAAALTLALSISPHVFGRAVSRVGRTREAVVRHASDMKSNHSTTIPTVRVRDPLSPLAIGAGAASEGAGGGQITLWANSPGYPLVLLNADGSHPTKLPVQMGGPSWTADGSTLMEWATTPSGGIIAEVMNPDGTHIQTVPLPSGARDAVISPDGTHVAFIWDPNNSNPVAAPVYVETIEGTNATEVSTDKASVSENLSWSPDSRDIVLGGVPANPSDQCSDFYVAPAAGGGATQLPVTISKNPTTESCVSPTYSPVGGELVFYGKTTSSSNWQLFTIPTAGGLGTAIPGSSFSAGAGPVDSPRVSPDGSLVAFGAYVQGAGTYQFSVMPVAGGPVTALPPGVEVFPWKPYPITVNQTSDLPEPAVSLGKHVCDVDPSTPGNQCTLRAAIQLANMRASPRAQRIEFDLPDSPGKLPTITLTSPLSAISTPIDLDASMQPGATPNLAAVLVDGSSAGTSAVGLDVQGKDSTVKGLGLTHFRGQGILLEGDSATIQDCAFYADDSGLEVSSNNDVVGGDRSQGNIFFANGDFPGLKSYADSLKGTKATQAQVDRALLKLGAGILIKKGGVSNVTIQGNLLGVHGSELSQFLPADKPDSPLASSFGVLIIPSTGAVSGVTIGGAGNLGNVITGDFMGVAAFDAAPASITQVSIEGNKIGTAPDGKPYEPIGNLIGVVAGGSVSGLSVGTSTMPNIIEGNVIGALLMDQNLHSATVAGNLMGSSDTSSSALGDENVIGVILGDTNGVMIGGPSPADGNEIVGDPLGIILSGKHNANNTVENNVIGDMKPPTMTINDDPSFAVAMGILDFHGSGNRIGGAGAGNRILGTGLGGLTIATDKEVVQGNTVSGSYVGWLADAPSRTEYGGSGSGQGNTFHNTVLGMLMDNNNLTPQELRDSHLDGTPTTQSDLEKAFGHFGESTALATVDATTTADIGSSMVDILPEVGYGNSIEGSTFSPPSGQPRLGNDIAMLLGGDLHGTQLGGLGKGEGNLIVDSHQAGIWLAGDATHYPTVSILGNSISHNDDFAGPFASPGLGIDIITPNESTIGPNPNDPKNPDAGPDGLQNYPVLTKVVPSGGSVTVSGTLSSAKSTTFTVELFSNDFCNPYKYGEGQQSLGTIGVETNANGTAHFEGSFAQPLKHAQYITATATTPATATGGGTSEFSKCAKM